MPGRSKGMAKKANTVEALVLKAFQRISKVTPEIHKNVAPRHGVSAPPSPWVAVHRLGCELLLATAELGDHYRKLAGICEVGPISTAFSKAALRKLREYQCTGSGRTLGELANLQAAADEVSDSLPITANALDESTWAYLALHTACRFA